MSGTGNGGGDAAGGSGNGNDGGCCSTIVKKLGLRPVTRCNIAKFYAPAFGAVSYTSMSINVMNPSLVVKVFPKRDITNFLLAGTLIGTGSYIYTREHMKAAPQSVRILYSATGAVLLSLGSVLLWAVIRSIVPPSPVCCTLAGIGTGVAFLKVGSSYLEFVDEQIAKK
ncbi:PREDICTED: uncharacterized protein LOC108777975 [Cyphomyrmex costatus]|uniref:Uncharacterized protein n=1 Tax=Cyphomyrmex costatus TaxID=456900 RepID=A0A195CBM6_9HYME|nr:PREDICTED: uncharacterized protein LOC108777975 [Cyphomyrmex costatus]KYM98100.1 hypothetical protein ALC62_11446 [Cyphomyrmex costatus]